MTEIREPMCDTYWGSHGCDLPDAHCDDEVVTQQCGDDSDPCRQIRTLPDGTVETRAALYGLNQDGTVNETDWTWGAWEPAGLVLIRMDGKPVR